MSQKYIGGFITKSPVAPTSSAASGMWTIDQAMQLKKQGNWPPTLPTIGSAFGGGFFAGQISTAGNSVADYNLVVGPVASAQNTSKQWKTTNTTTAGTSSVIAGPTNSANMNNASHPCAQFCEGLTIGGFSDWYMPAQNELEVCYFNLKPSAINNVTDSGINPNSVPARTSNYTSGSPTTTSATNFQASNSEAFAVAFYWSSTEFSTTESKRQAFGNGGQQYNYLKYFTNNVRAIRRVAV